MSSKTVKYKKRTGTSGINGQLYEIKLLTLILYRALKDEYIRDFYLGTNVDGIGAFDDVILKFKLDNEWIAVFIQAKHKDDPKKASITDNDFFREKGDFNLEKYFDSFLKIKERMIQVRPDEVFTADMKCYFIIYTPIIAKVTLNKIDIQLTSHMSKIVDLISTSIFKKSLHEDVFQIKVDDSLVLKLTQSISIKQKNDISESINLNTSTIDSNLMNQFFNSLFFFSNEGNQKLVEKVIKQKIYDCERGPNNVKLSKEDIDMLESNLLNRIQRWWEKPKKAEYLTNECLFVKESRTETIDVSYLKVLNDMCTSGCTKYALEFTNEAVSELLVYLDIPPNQQATLETTKIIITVNTNNMLLTCMKVLQSLRNVKVYFIDAKHYAFTLNYFPIEAIKNVNCDMLVVKCEYSNNRKDIERMCIEIVECFPKHVIVVTTQTLPKELHYNNIFDKNNGLIDLTKESQDVVLASKKVIIQGEEVLLKSVIDEERKHLISGKILLKLVNNENIEIGKPLKEFNNFSSLYYYVPRYIIKGNNPKFQVNNFKDVPDQVVIITAEPGMGKSTLISHLSIETKRKYPEIWIVRIDLLDHCSQFYKWKREEKKIDLKEAMTLVCNAEINLVKDKFDLEVDPEGRVFINNNAHLISKLHLNLIITSYNNGNIFFVFDGFDEICPDYKEQALEFIKIFVNRKVWITSRQNNEIYKTLVKEFGLTYELKRFSLYDQKMYYHHHFENNIVININDFGHLRNINGFLDYLKAFNENYSSDTPNLLNTTLFQMVLYLHAAVYIRQKNIHIILKQKMITNNDHLLTINTFEDIIMKQLSAMDTTCYNEEQEHGIIIGNPLYMFFAVNMFVKKIKKAENSNQNWDIKENSLTYIRSFIKMIFKKWWIEKTGQDITKPGAQERYSKEKELFIKDHKKLAMFTLFYYNKYYQMAVSAAEQSKIKDKIDKIKICNENSGLINQIYNNIPRYTHIIFAEYLAAEYIVDCIQSADIDKKTNIIMLICDEAIHKYSNALYMLEHLLTQNTELRKVFSESESMKIMYDYLFGSTIWKPKFLLNKFLKARYDFPIIEEVIMNSIKYYLDKRFLINLQIFAIQMSTFKSSSFNELNVPILDLLLNKLREIDPATVKHAFSGLRIERCLFSDKSNNDEMNEIMLGNQEVFNRINLEFAVIDDIQSESELMNLQNIHPHKDMDAIVLKQLRDFMFIPPHACWNTNTTTISLLEDLTKTIFNKKCEENKSNELFYENEFTTFIKSYKCLAFFSFFHNDPNFSSIIYESEYLQIKETIREIEQEKTKYDLIENIHNTIPSFTHYFLAQYFASEYIVDKICSGDIAMTKNMINFFLREVILCDAHELKPFFENKLATNVTFCKVLYSNESIKQIYVYLFGDTSLQSKNAVLAMRTFYYEFQGIFMVLGTSIINNIDKRFFECFEIYCNLLEISKQNQYDIPYRDQCFINSIINYILKLTDPTQVKDAVCGFRIEKCLFLHNSKYILNDHEVKKRIRLEFRNFDDMESNLVKSYSTHQNTRIYSHGADSFIVNKNVDFKSIVTYVEIVTKTLYIKRQKKKNNIYPSEMTLNEIEWISFLDNIKKLAFFTLFHSNAYFSSIVTASEYSEIKAMIAKIEQGEDFRGLIVQIQNNELCFTNLFLAQYFACEYIADKIGSGDIVIKKNAINFCLHGVICKNTFGLRNIFDEMLSRSNEFKSIFSNEESRKVVYNVLFGPNNTRIECDDFDILGLYVTRETTLILLNSIKHYMDRNFFIYLQCYYANVMITPNTDMIMYLLDMVKEMKPHDVKYAVRGLNIEECFFTNESNDMFSNQEILARLNTYRYKNFSPPEMIFIMYDNILVRSDNEFSHE